MIKGFSQTNLTQRIVMEAMVYLLIAAVMIFAMLLPARKKYIQAKKSLDHVQTEISRIEGLLPPGQDITTGLTRIQDEITQIDRRFPDKEEAGVELLANIARQNKIEILSLRPGARREFQDSRSLPFELDGKTCQVVSVALNGNGTFTDLIKFLENLEDTPDLFITIEQLELERASVEGSLAIRLNVSYYLMK